MDGLRPERDELERHHLKADKKLTATRNSAPTDAQVEAYVRLNRPAQVALVVMFIMLVALAVMGYWQYSRQLAVVDQMQQQLSEASRQLKQSNLMIAQLQSELQNTDSTLQQSGNEVARQLKFLDGEMRKLWDVSNKRNKSWILKAQADIKALNIRTQGLSGELQSQENRLEGQARRLDQIAADATAMSVRQAALDEVLSQTNESVNSLLSSTQKLETTLKEVKSRLEGQAGQLATLQRKQEDMARQMKKIQEQVNVVDRARRQIIGRFVSLDQRLSALEKAGKQSGASQ